jgi:flagellar biosynthetic protein FlhB
MSSTSGSRTEKPTPRREQKAREQGQVARSRDLAASLATLAGLLVAGSQAAGFAHAWRGFLGGTLAAATGELTAATLAPAAWLVLRTTGMIAGMAWLLSLSGSLAQGGFVFATEALEPKIERFSPAGPLKRLVSVTALAHLGKSLVPLFAMAYLAVALVARDWPQIAGLIRLRPTALAGFVFDHCFELAWKCSLVMLAWSGIDYFAERQKFAGQLRMSKQEIQEEHKETEGHPAIKARLRRLQRQVRRRRMMQDAERASVVVTNPTHFAVALEYRADMAAPTVVAKGQNKLAQLIRQLALWRSIPIVENPPLAQALYRAVEVGQAIPPKLYAVVAEVLALVWRAEAQAQATARAQAGGPR